MVVVGDRGYAALDLLDAVRHVATMVTRLRLDARLVAQAPPRLPHPNGRLRIIGQRLLTLEQVRASPEPILGPPPSRWCIAVATPATRRVTIEHEF
jgi:hypothetical protein